jgi:RNA polymerase sigma factor for flagellar operon FliA
MERELNRARERFTVLHGRGPTSAELADLLAIDEAELSELLADVHRAELGSLNAPAMSDDDTQIERLDTVASRDREFDPEFAAMREGAIARLREAFDELPERERKVALLLHVGRREVSFGKPG